MLDNRLKTYLHSQIQEIASSKVLRFYGAALALIHAVTWTFWRQSVPAYLSDSLNPFCWPFFSNCQVIHGIPSLLVSAALGMYLILALLTAAAFLVGRYKFAWFASAALFLFKLCVQVTDYRLMGNYHYMPQLITLSFLFLPRKKEVASLLMVLFYFAAGTLKINYEWLSGAALWRGLPFTASLWFFQVLLALVVFLEMVLAFGLLSSQKLVRWFTLACFTLFHIVSWHWVGYFYPVICFLMLGIFPLRWLLEKGNSLKPGKAGTALLVCVALAQVPARLFSEDHTLYGKQRIANLNMIDARAVCMGAILIHDNGKIIEYDPDRSRFGARITCDDIVYLNFARNICRSYKGQVSTPRVDVYLAARRTTDLQARELLNIKNFCENQADYL